MTLEGLTDLNPASSMEVLSIYPPGPFSIVTVSIVVTESTSKDHFSEAVIMEEGLGRNVDKTSIKEAGLKSVKPSEVIQSTDFAIGDINVAAKSINGRSKNSITAIEDFKLGFNI